jgi:hypothetical protein
MAMRQFTRRARLRLDPLAARRFRRLVRSLRPWFFRETCAEVEARVWLVIWRQAVRCGGKVLISGRIYFAKFVTGPWQGEIVCVVLPGSPERKPDCAWPIFAEPLLNFDVVALRIPAHRTGQDSEKAS